MAFQEILNKQKAFFRTQGTKDIDFRKQQLQKLKTIITDQQQLLCAAIYQDFGKSEFDTFTTEIAFVLKDIDYYLKQLSNLAKPQKVSTNLFNQPGNSKIYPDPLGNTLVIGAWNYPYQLSLSPMICAMAAGNTVILKPSELSAASAAAMASIINQHFPAEYLFVALGGVAETTELLALKYDKIFFTGSPQVGKIVYAAAAQHLTPVTLELGGKSPAIVCASADIAVAAKRIVWGKFLNAGQTCVAPDYILVEDQCKEILLQQLKKYILQFQYAVANNNYTQIINERNLNRVAALIDKDKIYHGGLVDKAARTIAPTILHNVCWTDAVMQEEIFGPVLPVLSFSNYNDALYQVLDHEKPLAAYLFSNNDDEKSAFTSILSFGGGCINDVIMHLGNEQLPFGGVGNSGMGHYHGKFGFDAFVHPKSVLDRATWGEPNIKYPPYTAQKLKWIKRLM
ncbi:MAG: aldehyde dehydrogenase [Chitinophagaceae bacterium]|nr:aldehyde dehydrogenase [Chitinophagaceae bacterium]